MIKKSLIIFLILIGLTYLSAFSKIGEVFFLTLLWPVGKLSILFLNLTYFKPITAPCNDFYNCFKPSPQHDVAFAVLVLFFSLLYYFIIAWLVAFLIKKFIHN